MQKQEEEEFCMQGMLSSWWERPKAGTPLKEFPRGWFWLVVAVTSLFAFEGGWINAIAFLGTWRTGLTHLTGSTTNGAIRIINPAKPGQIPEITYIFYILGFFSGAAMAVSVTIVCC